MGFSSHTLIYFSLLGIFSLIQLDGLDCGLPPALLHAMRLDSGASLPLFPSALLSCLGVEHSRIGS